MVFIILLVSAVLYGDKFTSFTSNLFYAKRYSDIVEEYSKDFGVDENLIYAVIREESTFYPFAKSGADARGLMQITPITWAHAQQNLDFKGDDYYNKNLNIKVGTWYLSFLMNYYNNEKYAICAYNAGLSNVDKWIEMGMLKGDDHTKWNIPFLETRAYLEGVLAGKEKYSKIEEKN